MLLAGSDHRKVVVVNVSGTASRSRIDHKKRFGKDPLNVEPSATEVAMKSVTTTRQHWLAYVQILGKNMFRMREWKRSRFSRCEHTGEDSKHVMKRQGSGAKERWEQSMKHSEVEEDQ